MDPNTDSLFSRLHTCETSHLASLHQEIYNLSREELRALTLDLIPALFYRLTQDSHLTSLHTLEYVITNSNSKEALLSLMELNHTDTGNYNLTYYLLHGKMLALLLNNMPASSLSHALPSHIQKFNQLVEHLSQEMGDIEMWEREEVEWMLSLRSLFEIDFKSYQLKQISTREDSRFQLNTLLISNSLLISSLSSLQQNSVHYLDRDFLHSLSYQLWLLGLTLSLRLTHRDLCTQLLFNRILRSRLKAVLALRDFSDLCPLFSSARPVLEIEEGEEEGFKRLVRLGLSHYIYLSISHPQRLLLDPVPLCISRGYLYECMCPVSCTFLSHSYPHVTSLGLTLLELDRGSAHWLGKHTDWEIHGDMCHLLTEVMLYSEDEECRRRAVILFKRLLPMYPPPLRHWLYRLLFWRVRAPPALGFLVSCLKEEVHLTMSGARPECEGYFTGPALTPLLRRLLRLEDTRPEVLIHETDCILSSLNLLRYLLLRDPRDKNHTQIWHLLSRVEAYSSSLSQLLEEAIHRSSKELHLSQKEESRTEKVPLPSQPASLLIQQDLNKLMLTQDINNRLREILLEQSATLK